MSAIPVVVAVVASLLAAVCAAGDGAILALDPEGEPPSTPVGSLTARRELTHRTLVFARLGAHLVSGAAFALALGLGARPPLIAALLALLLVGLTVTVSECIARAAGEAAGTRLLATVAPLLVATRRVFAPAARGLEQLDALLQRSLPAAPSPEARREETTEQFRQVVAAELRISPQARTLLDGVFSLGETEVREVMVPRVDMVGIDLDTPWSEVVDRVRSAGHARYPVFVETIDDVRGILYAKDLLDAVITGRAPAAGWAALVRPAGFIPTTKPLDEQLRAFQSTGSHIAIVVDEFGGTAGLVTIEDILEQIVGEIRDEHDDEEAEIVAREGRRFWVSGRVTLDELSAVTEHEFAEEDVSTVGGLIYARLGRVPRAGETLQLDGFRVVVEKVIGRRIRRVYFERAELLVGQEAE